MEKELKFQQEVWNKIVEKARTAALLDGGLRMTFCEAAIQRHYQAHASKKLRKELESLYKRSLLELETLEEFWCPKLKGAVKDLVGREGLEELMEITEMKMKCQFSMTMNRRSYRSQSVSYHVEDFIQIICSWIYMQGYNVSVKDMMLKEHIWVQNFEWKMALEIKRGNQEIINLIREAMLGENQTVLLSRQMILAVIISENEELLELLLSLLYAARLQEGLRQNILESADAGSREVLIRILKFCMDHDLFRYSSAVRALDTWTGLGYGDAKPALVKKCASLAYECLTDGEARRRYLDSEDVLEIYFAVWSMGCVEMRDCDAAVDKLVAAPQKYKQLLGWYFVSHTDSEIYQMHHASRHLEETDLEILAWVTANLAITWNAVHWIIAKDMNGCVKIQLYPNEILPKEKAERKKMFAQLKEIVRLIGKKSRTFIGSPFPFSSVTLENTRAMQCLFSLMAYDMDSDMLKELLELRDWMDVDLRRTLYSKFLDSQNPSHRTYLREGLRDRNIYVKELAMERLAETELSAEDIDVLTASLRSKSSDFRRDIINLFKKQDEETLSLAMQKMLASKDENQIQAAMELLIEVRETKPELLKKHRAALKQLPPLSTQTEILRKQLMEDTENTEENDTLENGFGLYRPEVITETKEAFRKYLPQETKEKSLLTKLLKKSVESELYDLKALHNFVPDRKDVEGMLERMNAVFVRHADYEYEILSYDGSRQKVLFGDALGSIPIPAEFDTGEDDMQETLEMIPFYEEFLEAAGEYATDLQKMLGMTFLFSSEGHYSLMTYGNEDSDVPYGHEREGWYQRFLGKLPKYSIYEYTYKKYKERTWQIASIVNLFWRRFEKQELCRELLKWYRSMVVLFGVDLLGRNYLRKKAMENFIYYGTPLAAYPMDNKYLSFWRKLLHDCAVSDEDFAEWFRVEYALEAQLPEYNIRQGLTVEEFFRAADLNLISKEVLAKELLLGREAPFNMRRLTGSSYFAAKTEIYKRYPWAKEFVDRIVLRIVEVETKRGELTTPLTAVALNIGRFEGVFYFVNLLAALGKEKFFRGYEYAYNSTKQAVLSGLLKHCYPAKDDTPEKMQRYLKETDIKEKRLAEAVMYAPQWAGLAEAVTGWKGLKRGVWFFHAHINEHFSAEKETEVAIYSPVTPQQFNDGTFEKDWFLQSYEELGEKRFHTLYQSAKYITAGSNQHRRSQLYSDAVLGRLDAQELKQEIIEKRNQEKLRCYPLIPLGEDGTDEALRRYKFIRQFQKESKQFGSQRRESEKKACNTALENLAITMQFADVNRMIWYLESEQFEQIRPLTQPKELEGYHIWLEIDESGTASLAIEKHGKRQKSVPAALKKKEAVLEIQATVKELKEQKRRGKESLEKAMVECAVFSMQELENIWKNPVLAPMIQALVWTDGERNGFLRKQENTLVLVNVHGEVFTETVGGELRIAHPHDLICKKEWAEFMHFLYEKKIKQPFKQVFREYYSLTEDERQEKNISRRYAGHQVQPKKTAVLLKGRGWTVDYEEGLQKVYYKENLIVRMYALADWFSPADIEAPTLEVIRFFDRNTNEVVDLEKVPPIIFSEAMRDMDLVVSVAHVGGVDPEESHSTVEMRTAIAAELVQLLKLSNVSFIGSHAKIQGKLNSYSVHMGSGIVHAEAVGMVAILPVHSQARGRIFLPFADDDPKTAEIMSKIILLAEDGKIKDTNILNQIRK